VSGFVVGWHSVSRWVGNTPMKADWLPGVLAKDSWIWGLILAVYALFVMQGFGPFLDDGHGFRQAQTAISARYFQTLGDFVTYATPVVGVPWSIPFEFPLYQALVKGLSRASGIDLVRSGRIVSMLFFLACVVPLAGLARLAGAQRPALALVPVMLAPLYLFWSRAVLIETTALFFTLMFGWRMALRLSAPAFEVLAWREGLSIALLGSLASLCKVTTFLPVLAGVLVWLVVQMWQRRAGIGRDRWVSRVALAGAGLAPLLVGMAWVRHTDALKQLNPIGAALTSQALRKWNFGTLADRGDPAVWHDLARRATDIVFPLPPVSADLRWPLAGLWVAVMAVALWHCDHRRRRWIAGLLALFVLPMALFTNLHRVHDYYQVANGVFLLLAFGLAIEGAMLRLERSDRPHHPNGSPAGPPEASRGWRGNTFARRAIGVGGLALLAVSLLFAQTRYELRTTHAAHRAGLVALLGRITSHGQVLVITGLDWSPLVPFEVERRALMLPDWASAEMADQAVAALRRSGSEVGALLVCGADRPSTPRVRSLLLAAEQGPVAHVDGCEVFSMPAGVTPASTATVRP